MQDHFTREMTSKSAQKQNVHFPKEFYPRPGHESTRDIGSVLNTDSNRRLAGGLSSSQYYENRDRGRFHDLKQIDDEAFAYADRREKEEKKN